MVVKGSAVVIGASVVGASVIGASVIGASVVGASVVGASVVTLPVSCVLPPLVTSGAAVVFSGSPVVIGMLVVSLLDTDTFPLVVDGCAMVALPSGVGAGVVSAGTVVLGSTVVLLGLDILSDVVGPGTNPDVEVFCGGAKVVWSVRLPLVVIFDSTGDVVVVTFSDGTAVVVGAAVVFIAGPAVRNIDKGLTKNGLWNVCVICLCRPTNLSVTDRQTNKNDGGRDSYESAC